MASVYEIITQKIIEQLEKGVIPWQKPWKQERPRNISGRPYKGVNLLLLAKTPYSCPVWATFKQISEKGGQVKKGERSSIVVFHKPITKYVNSEGQELSEEDVAVLDESEYEEKTFWVLRYYNVFNLEQATLEIRKYWEPKGNGVEPIERAEEIVNNMPNRPEILFQGQEAYYDVNRDQVVLPPRALFKSKERYYETLFHELAHSTGHEKRLNRKSLVEYAPFGSEKYSKEELVAQIASAFLCAEAKIEFQIDNFAAYCKGWLKQLNNNKKLIFFAASQAQKAADYILGKGGTHD